MSIAVPALAVVLAVLQSGAAPSSAPGSVPVQFLPRTAVTEQPAAANDQQTISAGAGGPYLSSIKLGDFEASGEISMPADGAARLLLYAAPEEDGAGAGRVQIPLPPPAAPGWQPMTVTSVDHHVRVSISGRVVADRDVEGEASGLFGFEVSSGQLSLQHWRVVRRDAHSDSLGQADSKDVVDATRMPRNAQSPRLRHEVKPEYTPAAMRRKVQGTVEVHAIVEPDGSVGPVQVTKGLDEDLDVQAVRAVKQWQFDPALVDGQPVACRVTIELSFVLRGR